LGKHRLETPTNPNRNSVSRFEIRTLNIILTTGEQYAAIV